MPTSIAIDIRNLRVAFSGGFTALDGVTLQIKTGGITGFIGPSGAGKSTLIRSIVGRQKISAGSIDVLGLAAGSAELRPVVSYMTQEVSVYPDLTVSQNLRYFSLMRGLKRRQIRTEVEALLDTLDLSRHAGQLVSRLSGGQKQRVSLAVALIGGPQLLVLDEPTVGLDPVLREQIWRLFRKLSSEGTTVVISSHVMDEAERCDDLVLIRAGSVLAHGAPKVLCARSGKKTVEQSFLALVEAAK